MFIQYIKKTLTILLISFAIFASVTQLNIQAATNNKIIYFWDNFTLNNNLSSRLPQLKEEGFNAVYLNIEFFLNPYLDRNSSFQKLTNLSTLASQNGIRIQGMLGNTTWANPDTNEIIYRGLEFIKAFNKQSYYTTSIQGLHLNIEFYGQPGFLASKYYYTTKYIEFMDDLAYEIKQYQLVYPDFILSTTMPHFADLIDYIPAVEYYGLNNTAYGHVARTLNNLPNSRMVIMAYRKIATGPNSVYDLVKNEFILAQQLYPRLEIIIALETVPEDPLITFYGQSLSQLNSQITTLDNLLYNTYTQYNSIAIHEFNYYFRLGR